MKKFQSEGYKILQESDETNSNDSDKINYNMGLEVTENRNKNVQVKSQVGLELIETQSHYHTLFKDIEDPKVLNAADTLNLIHNKTGAINIESNMSKSSKAIDNLIDFKPMQIPQFNRSSISTNKTTRIAMDPLSYMKIVTSSSEPEPIVQPLLEIKPSIQLIYDDDFGKRDLPQKIDESKPFIFSKPPDVMLMDSNDLQGIIINVQGPEEPRHEGKQNKLNLFDLCSRGEWALVEQLLKSDNMDQSLPHMKNPETGETPLMLACKENRLVIVERLLSLNVNVNEQAEDDRTALHYAAEFSKEEIIKLLLLKKANANIFGSIKKNLPLHIACGRSKNSSTVVIILLKATSNGRLQLDNDGIIPLIYAVECGSVTVVKELLEKDAVAQMNTKRKITGESAIHIACKKKNLEILKLLCDAECPINIQDAAGKTGLHIAAEEGDEQILKYLYTMKANANILDNMHRTSLYLAAERGHTSSVEYLIDTFKCNVLTRDVHGNTLMHITSLSGHPDTTMAFLKRGVPLHMPNKEGSLCLHAAAQYGHVNVVKALLDKGSDINARTKDLFTPLHIAVKYGNHEVVETLIGYGAEVNVKGGLLEETPLHIASQLKGGEKCAEMLLKSGANVNDIMKKGETSLHIAARTGNLEMVISLLEDGAEPAMLSADGNSSLHIAIRYCHLEVVNQLINFINRTMSRVDVVLLVNMPNNEGETPLHLAAELKKNRTHSDFEDTDIMKLLLEYDGDMSIQTKFTKETPLHYCASAGNTDILLEIVNHLDHKIQQAVNKQAKNGWSPLLFASHNGHDRVVNILLKYSARVDVFDDHGMTALHLACEKGHVAVAEVLLSNKAFVNAKSKSGLTPLHLAAQNGFRGLAEILVKKYRASIDAVTLNKKTPLHLAAQFGQKSVCEFLIFDKNNPADPNAIDTKHQTPMHLAAKNDHSAVVKLFLKFKPELLTRANTDGMTCAHIAAANGSIAVIKEFMKFNKSIIHGVKNNTTGSTPLHLAAEGGHHKLVQVLVEAGATLKEENNEGMTCLHLAAKFGHIDLLQYLKSKMNLRIVSNKSGMTPLHVAAHYGQIEFVREMLVEVPANIRSERPKTGEQIKDLLTESGLSSLHLAAQSGHENIVRLLLNCSGVEVDCKTKNNGTIPLHFAAENGHTNITSLLLSKLASQIGKKDNKGRTALHLSASHGHLEMVSLLIGQGAEINAVDNLNFTPLHFAAKSGYLRVCKLLVESGAIADAETNDFKTPLIFAAHFNHLEVVNFLLHENHSTERLMEDSKFLYNLMICSKLNDSESMEEFVLLSPAPAEIAAKLSDRYRAMAENEKERSKDLLSIADECEEMCVDLVSLAAAEAGADKLLQSIDCHGVQFLDILIETEQKEVIFHPTVQKYLSDVWMGNNNWPKWKLFLLLLFFAICPITWMFALLPVGKRFFSFPMTKFFVYFFSHIYITILLIYVSSFDSYAYTRSSPSPLPEEWLLLVCLSGQLISELINPADRKGIGALKLVILFFSSVAIFIHISSIFVTTAAIPELTFNRNVVLAIATLMCCVVFLDFISIHNFFGPWTIMMKALMADLFLFIIIFFIFMFGFSCMITAIYLPTQSLTATDSVMNVIDILALLFFSLYGIVSPDDWPAPNTGPSYAKTWIQIIFGFHLAVDWAILLNLLIAMMESTYQRIHEVSDTEWKFGRAKMIRNMKKTTPIPSPLIILSQTIYYVQVIYCTIRNLPLPKSAAYDYDEVANDFEILSNLRRKSQVAPESIRSLKQMPTKIEEVVDWTKIKRRFLALRSVKDEPYKTRE